MHTSSTLQGLAVTLPTASVCQLSACCVVRCLQAPGAVKSGGEGEGRPSEAQLRLAEVLSTGGCGGWGVCMHDLGGGASCFTASTLLRMAGWGRHTGTYHIASYQPKLPQPRHPAWPL